MQFVSYEVAPRVKTSKDAPSSIQGSGTSKGTGAPGESQFSASGLQLGGEDAQTTMFLHQQVHAGKQNFHNRVTREFVSGVSGAWNTQLRIMRGVMDETDLSMQNTHNQIVTDMSNLSYGFKFVAEQKQPSPVVSPTVEARQSSSASQARVAYAPEVEVKHGSKEHVLRSDTVGVEIELDGALKGK